MANEKKGLVDITTGAEVADANANGILDLTAGEVNQVKNIGATTITSTQWGYVGAMNQGVATTDNVQFADLTATGTTSLDGAVTINESGADVDFRVEGDAEPNLFFIDASTDRVGIGTNTPTKKFHVEIDSDTDSALFKTTSGSTGIKIESSGTNEAYCFFGNGTYSAEMGMVGTTGDYYFETPNGTEEFRIHNGGGISVNGGTKDASSLIDVNGTTQGARPIPSVTTTQRNAISSPATGLQVYNTDRDLIEWYDGDVWLNCHTVKLTNKSGAALAEGDCVVIDPANANSVDTLTTIQDNFIVGVIVEGGANNAEVTFAASGIWNVKFKANQNVSPRDWVVSTNVAGQAQVYNLDGFAVFAIAVESGTDTSAFLVKCLIGTVCDRY